MACGNICGKRGVKEAATPTHRVATERRFEESADSFQNIEPPADSKTMKVEGRKCTLVAFGSNDDFKQKVCARETSDETIRFNSL
jgi:hypothetical protein